jgi:Arc/MetJ-type ribon-helix-helix transcriptional regulator
LWSYRALDDYASADMAGLVKGAVDEGDYASTSEVIREALRDWKLKRELRLRQLRPNSASPKTAEADLAEIWSYLATRRSNQP